MIRLVSLFPLIVLLHSFIQQSHIEYPLHTTLCYDPGGTDVNKTKVPAKMELIF